MKQKIGTREYIKRIVNDPHVASITPTSKFGVRCVLKSIDFSKDLIIVEYGPGGGVITKSLLSKLSPNSKLIAIEKNEIFYDTLKRNLVDDRLSLHLDSAENIEDILNKLFSDGVITANKADIIISGIPFSMFPVEVKHKILDKTSACLVPDGRFLVYQFLFSLSVGKLDIKRVLRRYFEVKKSQIVLRNVPPLRVYEVLKRRQIKNHKESYLDYNGFMHDSNHVKYRANES